MCGIAGFLSPRLTRHEAGAVAERMAKAITSRGPDDHGVWLDTDAGAALAHRRLAVLDLSQAGHQPMISASGRLVIVFNGEIYNHRQLRLDIEAMGAAPEWRGHSDTETLLAGFEIWGLQSTLLRCVGMFAFGLWDRSTRRLTLARDRMGEKPLYYGSQGRIFLFGSELAALRAHPGFEPPINRDALAVFLNRGYVPSPTSIYDGVRKLPAGTLLELDAARWQNGADLAVPQPYWSLMDTAASRSPLFDGSAEEATDQLAALLMESIGGQMVADVDIGAFLSGGIDSSLVTSLMQCSSRRPIKTFTVGFNEAEFDEAPFARRVANHLGTDHTELYVSAKDALDVVPSLPSIYSEPFADSSQIPTYLLARLARKRVTVALSGDGGDELFGGYSRYFLTESIWRRIERLPRPIRTGLSNLIGSASPTIWNTLTYPVKAILPATFRRQLLGDDLHKGRAFLEAQSPIHLYMLLLSHLRSGEQIVLGANGDPWLQKPVVTRGDDFFAEAMSLDLATYLPDDILVKVDRASMAVGLETRAPLLDHRLVNFALSLPTSLKTNGYIGKLPMRNLLAKHLPSNLIHRPKMGFSVPIDQWLRGPLREWAESLIAEQHLELDGILNVRMVRKKWREHLSGQRDWRFVLWNVLMFQAWLLNSRQTNLTH